MGFKTEHDYETAYALHLKGLSIKQIAESTGIPEGTLQRYAHRKLWSDSRQRMSDLLSATVSKQTISFAEAYVHQITAFGDKALKNIISRGFDMNLDELGKLADVADKFDRIARRALRLDEQANSRPGLALRLNVTGNATLHTDSLADDASKNAAHVVDVQQISDEQPVTPASDAVAS